MREVATDCQLSVYAAKRAFRALEAAGQAERREFVEAGELVVQWRVPPHR